jgi:AcrR family transcriptional regulator
MTRSRAENGTENPGVEARSGLPGTEADGGTLAAALSLLWSERPAPTRGPKPALTLEAIARAGVALADADGLAALTMQGVAAALGYTKMALYRYIPGKDELVALMIDHGLGAPPPLAPAAEGWRPKLELWARRLSELFTAHPWTIEATTGIRALGPNELAWMEQAVAALDGTGLPGADRLDVAATLSGHVRATAQQGTAGQRSAEGHGSPEQSIEAVVGRVLGAHRDRYPALSAAFAEVAAKGGQDQALEFGLARILDGVELHIKQSRASREPS